MYYNIYLGYDRRVLLHNYLVSCQQPVAKSYYAMHTNDLLTTHDSEWREQ